jgi:hypothetical protein
MMRFLIASAAVLAALSAAPAFAADEKPKPDRSACFRADEVNGFNVIDDRTIDVSIGPRNVWRLTLFSKARDIDTALNISVVARTGSWVCQPMDATVIAPGRIGDQPYAVTAIRKLTPEELAPKNKPKA